MCFKQTKIARAIITTININISMDIDNKHGRNGIITINKHKTARTVNYTIHRTVNYNVIVHENNEKEARETIAKIREELARAGIPGILIN